MKLESLRDVMIDGLKDLYSAENMLVKALPKMAKAASSDELRDAFNGHLEETRQQVTRLDQVFKQLDESPKGKVCHAMKGLIEEGEEVIKAKGDAAAKDAALIVAAQKVEHYEIAGYGSMRTFAGLLDEDEVVQLLQVTLDEEAAADKKLTDVAESGLNDEAAEEEEESEEDEDEDEENAGAEDEDSDIMAGAHSGNGRSQR